MRTDINDKIYTVDEYIKFEWPSEFRHEFIKGRLFEVPHENRLNNTIRGKIALIIAPLLNKAGYHTFIHDIKVAIPNEDKYYYPDIFATREPATGRNTYIQYEPEIIVEVVSESTHLNDYVYKYIDYLKIPSLLYYVVVEPATTLIIVHEREDSNNWLLNKYVKQDMMVKLDKLNIEFLVKQVYK